MKKILKISLLLFLFGLNLSVAHAQSVSLVCPKSVKPGNKFTCTINASHTEEYGGIDATLTYSDDITYNSFTKNYSNGEIYNNKLSFYDVNLKNGTSKVGTITFTLSKNANDSQTISLTNIIMYDAESLGIELKNTTTTIKIDTSNNKSSSASSGTSGNASSGSGDGATTYSSKIKKLVINNGAIDFNKDVTEYEITVENSVTKLDIDLDLETSSSKYTITGNENFQVGENLVEITVTPKKGNSTIYKIKVNRLALSNDSLLENLKIANYQLNFKHNKFKYNIYINSDTETLTIEPVANERATVVIGGNEKLKTGSIVSIIVKAEDGSTSMYILRIIEKTSLIYLLLSAILFLGLLLGGIIIYKRRKKQKNQLFMDLKP